MNAVSNVGIVIVSHSPKVAEGAADMVRQMVGESVPLAWTGGNPEGGLGTDVAAIIGAMLAPFVLERMTDDSFRKWTRVIIFGIATVYLVRGGWMLWQR